MSASLSSKGYANLILDRLAILFVLSTMLLSGSLAAAQTDTFIAGSGNWSAKANWSLDAVPGQGNDCVLPSNSVVTSDLAGVCANFTMDSGDTLTVTPGYLDVYGASFVNKGAITVGPGNGLDFALPSGLTTISGSGTIALTNFLSGSFTGFENTVINNDNTIHGTGYIGVQQFTNHALIDANTAGGPLEVHGDGTIGIANTGMMQASNGGTLLLIPQALAVPFNNTGGVIQALNGSTVQMQGYTFTGGTLSSTGTGVIQGVNTLVLNNVTNKSNYQVTTDSDTAFQGTITNTGTITVQSGELMMSGNATLKGAGVVIGQSPLLLGSYTIPATLLNLSSIKGGGTIGDNYLTITNNGTFNANNRSLNMTAEGPNSLTNGKLMEASSGGTLEIRNVVHNTGATIEALTGSTVLLNGGTVSGGALSAFGTGVINSQNGTLDGTVNPVTLSGLLKASGGYSLTLEGTVNNNGTIALGSLSCASLNAPTTLTGSGRVTMSPGSCFDAFATSDTLTNQITIEGAGSIGDSNHMGITNSGTIIANQAQPLTVAPDSVLGFTNNGTLTAIQGSTLNIVGTFNNLPSTILTGGIYTVTGTLGVPNYIGTNSARVTLTGPGARIVNSSNNNAFARLAVNTSLGSLSLLGGKALTTAANLKNAGKINVGAGSSFSINGSYTQTGGTTTVDGTLSSSVGLILQKGSLVGKGTLDAVTTSDATITAGDSTINPGTLTVTGTYTQHSTGALNIPIGSGSAGKYGALAVSNGVSLSGTLNISLINGFVPTVGDTFAILTGSAVSGQFTTVNGATINSTEKFQVNYAPTAVTLTVISG